MKFEAQFRKGMDCKGNQGVRVRRNGNRIL